MRHSLRMIVLSTSRYLQFENGPLCWSFSFCLRLAVRFRSLRRGVASSRSIGVGSGSGSVTNLANLIPWVRS